MHTLRPSSARRLAVHLDGPAFAPHPHAAALFAAAGIDFVQRHCRTDDEVVAAVGDADAVLTCGVRVTARAVAAMSRAVIIARYGGGYDSVAVDAATAHGIVVANTPLYCVDEVSNHTIALLLATMRHIKFLDQRMAVGEWHEMRRARPIRRAKGATLGVIGFGNIAREVARKAQALGMHVGTLDRVAPDVAAAHNVTRFPLDTLLAQADAVSIHVP